MSADGGNSNRARVRLWKVALRRLADETGRTLAMRIEQGRLRVELAD